MGFSEFLLIRFRKRWLLIVIASFFLTVNLVLIADGRDICSPLLGAPAPAEHQDWTTRGYELNENIRWAYFGFNVLAFSLEAYCGYCGILTLLGMSVLIYSVVKALGILERHRDSRSPEEVSDPLSLTKSFKIQWDWDGHNGRCGLHEFDRVWGAYVLLIGLSICISGISILWNIAELEVPDKGSWILAVITLLMFPCAFIWTIYPYWAYFPDKRDDDPERKKAIQPRKWPFGLVLSWGYIFLVWGFWTSLVLIILRSIHLLPPE